MKRFGAIENPDHKHVGPKTTERKPSAKALELSTPEELEQRKQRFGNLLPEAAKQWLNTPVGAEFLGLAYKEPRKDVPASAQIRRTAIHVYGTDTLTTADVLALFAAYQASEVEWINDSSCNVVFLTEDAAAAALFALALPPPKATEAFPHPNPWRVGPKCKENVLLLRYAVPSDKKPDRGPLSQALAPTLGISKKQKRKKGRALHKLGETVKEGGEEAKEILAEAVVAEPAKPPAEPEVAMEDA